MTITEFFNLIDKNREENTIPLSITATNREHRIISHYHREVERKRMDLDAAIARCLGDIAGRNYHKYNDHITIAKRKQVEV